MKYEDLPDFPLVSMTLRKTAVSVKCKGKSVYQTARHSHDRIQCQIEVRLLMDGFQIPDCRESKRVTEKPDLRTRMSLENLFFLFTAD